MTTLKEQLQSHRQKFLNELFAAITKFEESTGAKIEHVSYNESANCKLYKPTAMNFVLRTDLE